MKYIGVCTPAWTIPGGRKMADWKNLGEHPVPGPGNYKRDPSDRLVYRTAPKWKIGTSKRGKGLIKENKVPGPGNYNPYAKKSQSQKILRKNREKPPFITKEKRFRRSKRDQTVGPGSYNHKKLTRSAPKFTFGYKFDDIENGQDIDMKTNVGPGLYEPQYKHKEFSKGKTIAKTGRKGPEHFRKTCAPGPGYYKYPMKKSASSYTSRKGTFGSATQSRFKKVTTDSPGVGSYDLKSHTISNWLKNKKIRVPNNQQIKIESSGNDVPGPGAYQPEIRYSKRVGPSYTIGTGKRPQLNQFDPNVPGPGKYFPSVNDNSTNDTDYGNNFRTTFGSSNRVPLAPQTGTPGPKYNVLARTNSAPKFSFKGRKGAKLKREDFRFPGPGSYFTSHNFMVGRAGPAHLIGTQRRFFGRRKEGTPGPGDYNIAKGIGFRGPKFPKSRRKGPANVDPDIEVGPGTYDIKNTVPQLQPWEEKAQKEAGFRIALD